MRLILSPQTSDQKQEEREKLAFIPLKSNICIYFLGIISLRYFTYVKWLGYVKNTKCMGIFYKSMTQEAPLAQILILSQYW